MLADQREAYNHIISITKKEVRRHSLFSKAIMYFMARFNCCWTSWRVAGLSIQVQNRASTQFERGEKIQKWRKNYTLNISGWLSLVFLFCTESREEELKNTLYNASHSILSSYTGKFPLVGLPGAT